MPFEVVPRGGGYVVRNAVTKRVFSDHPLPLRRAKKQLYAVTMASNHWALSRRRRYRRMLGSGWWDDIKGFFTKAYDATIGKIPVIGDIGRKVAGVVFNPINTLGNVAQKVTSGDIKGAASEAVAGVKRAIEGPNLAQALTHGTPLSGLADFATDVVYNTVKVPGTPISLAKARDAAKVLTDVAERVVDGPKPKPAPAAGEPADGVEQDADVELLEDIDDVADDLRKDYEYWRPPDDGVLSGERRAPRSVYDDFYDEWYDWF